MYLLYFDDSGSTANTNEEYLVLGGLSVFERRVYYLSGELDDLAAKYDEISPEADHVAYSIFRSYQTDDMTYLKAILPKFHADQNNGKLHGFVHKQTYDLNCMYQAYMSHRFV